jgi:hypothetical protein
MTPAAMPEPNTELALAFLDILDPKGRHDLFAIHPDLKERQPGKTEASTFLADERADTRDWINEEQGRRNIYYTVNQAKDFESLEQRLKKSDIGQIRAIVADVDAAPQRHTVAIRPESISARSASVLYALPKTCTPTRSARPPL